MGKLHKQYGVLPYFKKSGKIKMILITSRNSNRWIVPKGNQMPHKTKRESALQEAYEESGLIGLLDENVMFCIPIMSHGKKTDLTLYPMRVNKPLIKKWPERHQRKRIEVSCEQALSLVAWPGFGACIKLWKKSF
jgi:8-oxo-dGTP pyrophosphatase MutT (NUDIX family)